MRDSLFNLLFRCRHRKLSRPFADTAIDTHSEWNAYVICLDCSMRFAYDTKNMRMGGAIRRGQDDRRPGDRA